MPGVKDITGDLGKLSQRKAFSKGGKPALPAPGRLERRPAFNASSFFSWTVIALFIGLQAAFIIWLIRW